MKEQQNEEIPVNFFPYGVFQILEGQNVVDYGIGVLHEENRLVTFGKYLQECRTIGRVFFKKLVKGQVFPLSFDFSKTDDTSLIFTHIKNTKNLEGGRFINALIDNKFESYPQFLPSELITRIDSGKKGYAISLNKSNSSNILLHKVEFELKTHIRDLRLSFQEAILFVFNEQKGYCYGFYENPGNDEQGNDLYVPNELLKSIGGQNEAFTENHQEEKVINPAQRAPFQSIGILRFGNNRGTAQLLKSEDGCKYLITCAHNFVGGDLNQYGFLVNKYDNRGKLQIYSLELPKYDQSQELKYKMETVQGFIIKKVHIPQKYLDYFEKEKVTLADMKSFSFPLQLLPIRVYQNTLYDIAIIELQDNLKELTHGFEIGESSPIQLPVEVSGFPEGFLVRGKFFGITQGNMYSESTAVHDNDPSYVQLSKNQGGSILFLHRLSTLAGNSGSPIYERKSETQCRLIGIHTTGAGMKYYDPKDLKQKDLLGTHNYGTYIHSPNIKSWLNSVFNK